MFDEKTTYSIVDEHGDKSSITLEKWIADILQCNLPNVHQWVQESYERVALKKPELSRRQKGDLVRMLAAREVEKYPEYKALMDLI